MKRLVVAIALLSALVVTLPSSNAAPRAGDWRQVATQAVWRQLGDPSFPRPPVPTPTNRASGWTPAPAGTTRTIDLDFGPYVVNGGADLSRLDFTPAVTNGYT